MTTNSPAFSFDKYWAAETQSHLETFQKTRESLGKNLESVITHCADAIKNNKKLLFAGNGGSAADAQHLATELTIRYINDRKPIPAIALTTDSSALTAAGNDLGFDHIFSRQIDAIGNEGDVFFAISTSGNSPNILSALKSAKEKNMLTIGLSGRDGGKMKDLCDLCLIVPSPQTARIQEMHILLGHMLCGGLEQTLGLTPVENP